MALTTQTIPKTSVFLDDQLNPTTRVVSKNLVSGNDASELFTLRTILLNSPLISLAKDIDDLSILNPVKLDYNDFILIFKSIEVAPYTTPQIYAFPIQVEIINSQKFTEKFPIQFEEFV